MSTTNNENQKEIKDMSGYIAKNTNRTKDTQPHLRGKIRINGKEYLLSVWEKNGDVMSVSVTDPDQLEARRNTQGQPQNQNQAAAPAKQTTDSADGDLFKDIFG